MRIAIVPARSGSTRIKDKNIYPFCGKPLIHYPLAAARESGLFDMIHVSTESPAYAEVVKELGFPVDFLRDDSLAGNDCSMIDILRWILGKFDELGRAYDEVCMFYATAPLIDAQDVVRGYELFAKHGGRKLVLAVGAFPAPIERALEVDNDGILKWVHPEKRFLHSQDCITAYYDAAAFIFMSREQLFECRQSVFEEYLPLVLPRWKAVDINEPEDLEVAELLYLGRQAKEALSHR